MDAWFCAVVGVWGLFGEGNWSSYEYRREGTGRANLLLKLYNVVKCF